MARSWSSSAAVEGFGDLVSAWMWNDESESNCTYDRHYASDFDLDGAADNGGAANGLVDCEGIPTTGLASYVTSRDWLEDLMVASDPAGCGGLLVNRGTQYDWLRYGWDMLTDEGVPIEHYVDIYAADPQSWDPDDNFPGSAGSTSTSDDVIVRWLAAAANHPGDYDDEHLSADDNGQDH